MSSRVIIGITIIRVVGVAIGRISIGRISIGWVARVVRPIHLYLIRVFISYIRIYHYDSV